MNAKIPITMPAIAPPEMEASSSGVDVGSTGGAVISGVEAAVSGRAHELLMQTLAPLHSESRVHLKLLSVFSKIS